MCAVRRRISKPLPRLRARGVFEPIADSAVQQQMADLAQELASRVEAPLPGESTPAMAQEPEPMNLGASDAPIIDEPAPQPVVMREIVVPQEREKRGMFSGLFGGRRRVERNERSVEPALERPRAPDMNRAIAQPIGRTAPAPQPATHSSKDAKTVPQPRTAEARQPAAGQADDLFAGVAEDDRFEIPAFLRRQAKTGS